MLKKTLIGSICWIAVAAMAEAPANMWPQEGGTWLTAHKATDEGCSPSLCNEKTFYVSNKTMNWWSAWTWCVANGGRLARFQSLCPGNVAYPNQERCLNLPNETFVWTDKSSDEGKALVLYWAKTTEASKADMNYYKAICEI